MWPCVRVEGVLGSVFEAFAFFDEHCDQAARPSKLDPGEEAGTAMMWSVHGAFLSKCTTRSARGLAAVKNDAMSIRKQPLAKRHQL